ncbi:MAG: hypothetical protein ACR2JK_00765, partial [Geodermatophilaceae bacterium]
MDEIVATGPPSRSRLVDADFVDHVAPVDVDLVDFVDVDLVDFIDVICSDDEWLRAEFDAIIAASWSGPRRPRM